MKLNFFKHQSETLDATYDFDRVGYFLDMGLGKTFVGSEKMYQFNTPYNLLICQKSKIKDWEEHFKTFYPELKPIIFDKQSLDIIPTDSVLIINYDKVWRRPELTRLRNFTLMLDESSLIKNEKSNRSKFILKLKARYVILLSGTPTGGKYEELWSQLKLLGWNINKDLYMKQYVKQEWDDLNGGYKIVGYKNVDRLKKKLKDHGSIFIKTDEVYDLPKTNEIMVKIPSTKLYKEFAKHHIVEFEGEALIGDTPTSAKMYSRQLAGFYNHLKVEKVKELIESTNDRLVIFYQFKGDYEVLSKLCQELKRPIATTNGDLKDMSNYEKYDNSVSLIQYQAGAMGLNLQKANKMILFTLTESSELYQQCLKRIHRLGQDRPCFYYYLLTDGSVEWRMLAALKQGKDYTDKLFEKEGN
ncbi:MAG: DEAD/DEAH box helicase [Vagococcus sp.]